MARKRAAKKPQRRFIVLTSSCGDLTQAITDLSGVDVYSTESDAKDAAYSVLEQNETETGDNVDTIYIAEIVARGKPDGMKWE